MKIFLGKPSASVVEWLRRKYIPTKDGSWFIVKNDGMPYQFAYYNDDGNFWTEQQNPEPTSYKVGFNAETGWYIGNTESGFATIDPSVKMNPAAKTLKYNFDGGTVYNITGAWSEAEPVALRLKHISGAWINYTYSQLKDYLIDDNN